MSIFEKATRMALRFESVVGDLTTEQLWDLPLTSRSMRVANLDQVARTVNHELKELEETSFVETKPDPRKAEFQLKLEVVKHIIDVRLKEAAAAEQAALRADRKRKLLEALAAKENEQLSSMSKEQIEAAIAEL